MCVSSIPNANNNYERVLFTIVTHHSPKEMPDINQSVRFFLHYVRICLQIKTIALQSSQPMVITAYSIATANNIDHVTELEQTYAYKGELKNEMPPLIHPLTDVQLNQWPHNTHLANSNTC